MKSEEDFRHSMVVTRLFKTLTWILIILLNLGLIFFTMLRGLQRGYDWQVRCLPFLDHSLPSRSALLESLSVRLSAAVCGGDHLL
jgi:hypothetical protein